MYKNLTQNFSWSLFKHNIFGYCERAYYHHYYGSWNGWDQYAPQEAQASFRLKHLKTKELWAKSILKKAIINTIRTRKNTSTAFTKELKKQLQKILTSDLRNIHSEAWKKDPKQTCIDKIYYKEENVNDISYWIKEQMYQHLASLQNSKLIQKLSNIPYPAFTNTEQPLFFYLDDLKVWCSPDLTWQYHGQYNILNFNLNNRNWAFLAGINTLLFSQNNKIHYSEIISHTVFFEKNNCIEIYGIKHPKEIKKIIKESASQIHSRLSYNQKAYKDNFPKTAKIEKCKHCCFREICL